MPIFKSVNQNFFKKWTPEMAYVLGFFAAYGNMIKNNRGAHFIAFYSTDRHLIDNIRALLGSNHKIALKKQAVRNRKWKSSYQLQIGSKEIFSDLIALGMVPNKSLILKMPAVPTKYLNHFVRGYFDGDGHVSVSKYQRMGRKNKSKTIITGFTSGSKIFLQSLRNLLKKYARTEGGTLFTNDGYRLCFSVTDSERLYNFMYGGEPNLYLERKKT